MVRLQSLALCFLLYYGAGDTASVSFIKFCEPKDAACIKASATDAFPRFVAGVPEIGLMPVEPIVLDDVRADDKNLKLGFRNIKVSGITKCKVLDFVRDIEKSFMKLDVECPITATGQYSLDGKLLLLHATGDGDFTVQTDKVKLEATVKVKVVDIEGKKHWKVTGFDYNYDIIDKASIRLENLFGGDETSAKPIKEVLEKNPTELIKEIGRPIIKELFNKTVDIVAKIFEKMPISDFEKS